MSRVTWTAENDKKLLLQLMMPASKDIPIEQIATLFPGATPKSIIERIAKLRRDKKSISGALFLNPTQTPSPAPSTPETTTTTTTASTKGLFNQPVAYITTNSPTKPTRRGARSALTGEIMQISAAPRGKKRGRPSTQLLTPLSSETAADPSPLKLEIEDPITNAVGLEEEDGGGISEPSPKKIKREDTLLEGVATAAAFEVGVGSESEVKIEEGGEGAKGGE